MNCKIGKLYAILCVLAITLIASCARVGNPTGGTKDEVPPVLLKASPVNGKVNFTSKQIVLQFDEYVKLSNLKQQLIISPALDEEPEIRIKKRSIIIDLKRALKENTTYNFNFGDAIVDVNEGNIYKNFTYVLSTGNYLDTMQLMGKVVDAYSYLPKAEYSVMLYKDTADSVPIKQKPYYFSRTDKEGIFTLQNLKQDNYKIVSILDKNKNFLWDANEEIAYSDSLQKADTVPSNLMLRSFIETPKKLVLIGKKLENNNRLTLVFNKACDSCRLIDNGYIFAQNKTSNKDSLLVWLKPLVEMDSLQFYLHNGNSISDTLVYNIKLPNRKTEIKPLQIELTNGTNQKASEAIAFKTSEPLLKPDSCYVNLLKSDSSTFISKLVPDTSNLLLYKLDFKADFGEKYQVTIPDSTWQGYYGAMNKADSLTIEVPKEEYYGKLILKIDNKLASNAILIIIGEKLKASYQVNLSRGKQEQVFSLMPPDQYQVLVIADANANGKWDAGEYLNKLQPEQVLHYKEPINIRSNWDLDLEWEIVAP